MGQLITVEVTHVIAAPPEAVFAAWLDPPQVSKWMGMALKSMGLAGEVARVEIDPEIGGTFLFSDFRDGIEHRHWGKYLEMQRPDRIDFTWNTVGFDESETCNISLTLQPDHHGCKATLCNEMDEKWSGATAQTENGWRCMLEAQDALLKGEDRGG